MRKTLLAAAALGVLLLASEARPQSPGTQGVTDKVTTQALSTASGGCLAANPARRTLTIDNTYNTINVGYCQTPATTPSSACTAAIGTAGTTTIAAGGLFYWTSAPQNQFCFIAASGTPSITIREGQ